MFLKKLISAVTGISLCCLASSSLVLISSAVKPILDPNFLQAINSTLKEDFPKRTNYQEILEADIPYVKSLIANNMGITDITGIEQFTDIVSTIDLSNNSISDITPLINWAKNKEAEHDDKNLEANIFLGNNPILTNTNAQQIFSLSNVGPYIRIYSEQREGGSVTELAGFADGRPVDLSLRFDDKKSNPPQANDGSTTKEPVNTGTDIPLLLACLSSVLFVSSLYFKQFKQSAKIK